MDPDTVPYTSRVCRGWNFEELLRSAQQTQVDLRLRWGSVHVHVQILNWLAWPELFSLPLLCVSLVMANEWGGAFFWPIAFSHLCCACDTQMRKRLRRGARPKVSLRSQDVRLKSMYIECLRMTNNSASGTTFHYERKYKSGKARGPLTIFAPESIRALGPITESLYIVVSPLLPGPNNQSPYL
jgi:hypothetical protein